MPTQLFFNSIITASGIVILGCGFYLITSACRFFNFAYGAIYSLAAYCAYLFFAYLGISLLYSCLIGICVGVFVSVGLDAVVFTPLTNRKASSLILLVASLGLYIVLENTIALFFGSGPKVLWAYPSTQVYEMGGARITSIQLITILLGSITVISLILFQRVSRIGIGLRAIACNQSLASIVGLSSTSLKTTAIVIGSILAGIGGVLAGLDVPLTPTMGLIPLMLCIIATVIGFPRGIFGIAVAALAIGLARNYGAWILGTEWQEPITFLILFVVLLFKPQDILMEVR